MMAAAKKPTSAKSGDDAKRQAHGRQRVILGAAKPGKISVGKLRKAIRDVVERRVAGSSGC